MIPSARLLKYPKPRTRRMPAPTPNTQVAVLDIFFNCTLIYLHHTCIYIRIYIHQLPLSQLVIIGRSTYCHSVTTSLWAFGVVPSWALSGTGTPAHRHFDSFFHRFNRYLYQGRHQKRDMHHRVITLATGRHSSIALCRSTRSSVVLLIQPSELDPCWCFFRCCKIAMVAVLLPYRGMLLPIDCELVSEIHCGIVGWLLSLHCGLCK